MALTSLTSLTSPFAKVEFNIYLRLFVSYYNLLAELNYCNIYA